jgi:hypothetical protein
VSITFPEGVIVRATKFFTDAYLAVLLVVFVLGPLVTLHGYRVWWVVTFYALFAVATIGGSVSRFRLVRRTGKADPAAGHHAAGQRS